MLCNSEVTESATSESATMLCNSECATLQTPTVGESFKGRNGQKIAIVSACSLTTYSPCRRPFAMSVFQPTGLERRLNLDMVLEDSADEIIISQLDRRILKIAHERSIEWFGKQLSPEQIESRYVPMCRHKEGQTAFMRAKVNLDTLRVWDHNKAHVEEIPACYFKGMNIRPRIQLTAVWFQATQFGCTLVMTDVQIPEQELTTDCPF